MLLRHKAAEFPCWHTTARICPRPCISTILRICAVRWSGFLCWAAFDNVHPRIFIGGSMFVLGNIIFAVARVMDTLLTLYFWVVIISALLTWVRPDPYNPVVRTLNALTEPVLYRIRKWLPLLISAGWTCPPSWCLSPSSWCSPSWSVPCSSMRPCCKL